MRDHIKSHESYVKEMKELLEGFRNGIMELPEGLCSQVETRIGREKLVN
jgi:hypothetical protein